MFFTYLFVWLYFIHPMVLRFIFEPWATEISIANSLSFVLAASSWIPSSHILLGFLKQHMPYIFALRTYLEIRPRGSLCMRLVCESHLTFIQFLVSNPPPFFIDVNGFENFPIRFPLRITNYLFTSFWESPAFAIICPD